MFNPHCANHQYVTDMAKSAAVIIKNCPDANTNELQELFGRRVHELMRFRSHTVNTDW